jgi:hypothetical protein
LWALAEANVTVRYSVGSQGVDREKGKQGTGIGGKATVVFFFFFFLEFFLTMAISSITWSNFLHLGKKGNK